MYCTAEQARAHSGKDFDFNKASGYTSMTHATIYLIKDDREGADYVRLTFWHELEHAIEMAQGNYYEDHNEAAIEAAAQYRHQFDKTRKGETKLD